jgi:putative phosphoesterase
MKIGVVSDTHGFFDPRLKELLAGAEAILHAGDVGSQEVLDELENIAPVHAVRGNVDPTSLKLPPSLVKTLEGLQVEIRHELPVPQSELEYWMDGALLGKMQPERRDAFLKAFRKKTRVVVFGHSHQPCLLTLGHTLFFNPGSAGHKRFSLPRSLGVLEIFPRGVRGTILSLERYNEKLPGKVWLPVAET